MNMLNQMTYADTRTPRFFSYSASHLFPRAEDSFVQDSSGIWNDALIQVVRPGFDGQCDLTMGMAPDFIDPRTVVDRTIPVKREMSPYSPVSSGIAYSRPISPGESHSELIAEDHQRSPQTLGYHPSQFLLSSVDMHPLLPSPTQIYSTVTDNLGSAFMSANSSYRVDNSLNDPLSASFKAEQAVVEKNLTPPPSPPVRRRGPGRPSKAQMAAQYSNNNRPTGHSAVKRRRQMHNDSAMRSRARLNSTLEELWNIIPKHERVLEAEVGDANFDDNRELCRAMKVEVAVAYLKKLQSRLASRESRTSSF